MQPDLMYYWTHSESQPPSAPPPGKLSPSVWPTHSIPELPEHKSNQIYSEAGKFVFIIKMQS